MATAAADMKITLEQMKNMWPEIQFSKEDFTKPESVVRFYSYFIAEINEKVSFMINEEYNVDGCEDLQEIIDHRLRLYSKVAKILQKMKPIFSISILDFYVSNKNMYSVIKISTHFLVYLNNILDEVVGMIDDKQMESKNLKTLKKQFLEDEAENAENIQRCMDTYENLKATFEKVKHQHEKMMEDKILDLQSEVDNLEDVLKLLEDEENDLQKRIIEKLFEQHAKSLSVLSFDTLDTETLQDLKKRAKADDDVQKKLNDELIVLNNTVTAETKKLEEYERALAKTQSYYKELQKNVAIEQQNELNLYQNRVAKCSANFEECQRLECKIISIQEDIKKLNVNEHTMNVVVAQEYNKVLNKDGEVAQTFHNMLMNLKNVY